jgi:XTP/dITP diphosphohydrolase
MKILIATSNPHKLEEIRAVIRDASVELVSLNMLPGEVIDEPVEDRDTFEGNAELKARYYAKATGMLCLADDSGLEVDALNGEPGVRSARYSNTDGPRAERDAANSRALLKNLGDTPIEKRTARFVCAMALVDGRASCGLGEAPRSHVGLGNEHAPLPGAPCGNAGPNTDQSTVAHDLEPLAVVRGTLEGRILAVEETDDPTHPERGRGSNGFGYDPIVYVPDKNKTVAELTSDEKNAISHRGDAVRKIWPRIQQLTTAP